MITKELECTAQGRRGELFDAKVEDARRFTPQIESREVEFPLSELLLQRRGMGGTRSGPAPHE